MLNSSRYHVNDFATAAAARTLVEGLVKVWERRETADEGDAINIEKIYQL